MLGAFRFLVKQENGTAEYSWKTGSFDKVKQLFDTLAADLISRTQVTSVNNGRNPNAIGKDENHWDILHKTVALEYLKAATKS